MELWAWELPKTAHRLGWGSVADQNAPQRNQPPRNRWRLAGHTLILRTAMRAMVVTQFGAPEVLQLQERPRPAPNAQDLLIEVHAAALNPVDFKVRRGAFGKGRTFPFVPGYDVSGVVRETGSAVREFKIGDAVYASPSLVRDGANAEF